MTTKCVLYASYDAAVEEAKNGNGVVPAGAMWPAPWYLEGDAPHLSEKYKAARAADPGFRPPIVVKLPNDAGEFCVDSAGKDSKGWNVSGEPPRLTVSPSIHVMGGREMKTLWHGYLRDGVLTDA